jgi:hypothetical protein
LTTARALRESEVASDSPEDIPLESFCHHENPLKPSTYRARTLHHQQRSGSIEWVNCESNATTHGDRDGCTCDEIGTSIDSANNCISGVTTDQQKSCESFSTG